MSPGLALPVDRHPIRRGPPRRGGRGSCTTRSGFPPRTTWRRGGPTREPCARRRTSRGRGPARPRTPRRRARPARGSSGPPRRLGRRSPAEEGTGAPRGSSPRWRPHRRPTCLAIPLCTRRRQRRRTARAEPIQAAHQPTLLATGARRRRPGPARAAACQDGRAWPTAPLRLPPVVPVPQTGPGPDILTVSVEVGRRALIVANLGLEPQATAATTWASSGLARALDTWEGPGLVVVAGNLLDLTGEPDAPAATSSALAAHPRLARALQTFAGADDRRVISIPGATDADRRLRRRAASSRPWGSRSPVPPNCTWPPRQGPGSCASTPACGLRRHPHPRPPGTPGATRACQPRHGRTRRWCRGPSAAPSHWPPTPRRSGRTASRRLADPASTPRFLTSRLLYRRFARFAWWLLVPFAIAISLRLPFVSSALDHLVFGQPAPSRAIQRAHEAPWGARLLFAALVCIAELVILAVALGFVARKAWRTLGGGDLDGPFDDTLAAAGATANDDGPRRGPGPVRPGLRRARQRDHAPGRADPSRPRVLRLLRAPRARSSRSITDDWACSRSSWRANSWPGWSSRPAPSSTPACCSRGRSSRARHCSSAWRRAIARSTTPTPWSSPPIPTGLRGHRHRTSARSVTARAGSGDGRRERSPWPGSSTCSPRSHHPCGAACTWCSSSFPTSPARPPVPWWPWWGSASWPWPVGCGAASAGRS